MENWNTHPIILRADGSYVITRNGLPYHVPNEDQWTDLHAEIADFVAAHPNQAEPENLPQPSPEEVLRQLQQRYTALTQNRLDTFARTRGYDNIHTAASYAGSSNPSFAAEGQYCLSARDRTWETAYAILAQVQSGARDIPVWEDLETELPALEWPV